MDINDALKKSKNTIAMRLFSIMGAERIFNHLKNDYGFDSLVDKDVGATGNIISDLGAAPLALGQLSYGVSLRKLTEAYNVFPAEGIISTGRSYSVIYDKNGKELLKRDVSRNRIYSPECAQVMNQLLANVVNDGTARRIKLKEIIDVAGKTGTSGNDRDRLFIGYTPYYTAGIWCGYAKGDKQVGINTPSHLDIWNNVMTLIHERLVFDDYDEKTEIFNTDKIIISPYCSQSGLKPKDECALDDYSVIKFGYYKSTDELIEECDYH